MSFDLDAYKSGTPAIDRTGALWVFDACIKDHVFPLKSRAHHSGVNASHTTDGRYWLNVDADWDLVSMYGEQSKLIADLRRSDVDWRHRQIVFAFIFFLIIALGVQ